MNERQPQQISIAIVEDHGGTREGWVNLLSMSPRIKCVAACESAESALIRIPKCRPQVVLMDIQMPGVTGLRCAKMLKQLLPKTQILMLTAFSDDDSIFEALQAGASGYLLKSTSSTDLIRSIIEVADGGAPMSGKIARRVIQAFRKPTPKESEAPQLTTRENEILQLLAKGYANKEIASQLECRAATVGKHLEHIYEKLHVHCRTEAATKYFNRDANFGPMISKKKPDDVRLLGQETVAQDPFS